MLANVGAHCVVSGADVAGQEVEGGAVEGAALVHADQVADQVPDQELAKVSVTVEVNTV